MVAGYRHTSQGQRAARINVNGSALRRCRYPKVEVTDCFTALQRQVLQRQRVPGCNGEDTAVRPRRADGRTAAVINDG